MGEEVKEKIKAYYVANDIDEILDYITNLQEENERLKELNENASKVCIAEHRYGVEKAEEARYYKSRCEKAIEYIKEHQRKDEFLNLNEWQTRDLLNILNGGENNVKD